MKYGIIVMKRSEFDKLSPDEQCLFVLCFHIIHRIHVISHAIIATRGY